MRMWLGETHGAQFELLRHFFAQQFATDLTSSDQVRRLVITVLAALACLEPLILRIYIEKYEYLQGRDTADIYLAAVQADRLFLISLSMIVAGGVSIFLWQRLYPTREDYLALKPLPIRMYQVLVARFLSAFVTVVTVILILNFAAIIFFPLLTSGRWQRPSFGLQYVLSHAAANLGAGIFAFLALNAVQGALMNALSSRVFERLSVLIQTLLAAAVVGAVPYVLDIPNWSEAVATKPRALMAFPPAWFLGLYQTLLGARDGYWMQQRNAAILAIGAAAAVVVATYSLNYRRHATRVADQSGGSNRRSLLDQCDRFLPQLLVKKAPEQAAVGFAIHTLRRSRYHRLMIGFWLTLGGVFALRTGASGVIAHLHSGKAWSGLQLESILAVPLFLGAVLVSALSYVFQLPSNEKASWVFRMAESGARREMLDSAETLMFWALAIVILGTTPVEVLLLGLPLALSHLLLVAVLTLLLVEFRLNEWHKVPFTCSYVPGRRNFWELLAGYLFLFGVVVPGIAHLESSAPRPAVFITLVIVLSVLYFPLRSARMRRGNLVPLLFDEADEPLIQSMRLNHE